MGIVTLLTRLLLVGVFAVAAIGKLTDRRGSNKALIDFGLPISLARPLGLLLPLVELTVALLLVPTITAWWGALGALMLLLIFTIGIGINLARGVKPDCHCFGQLHSSPVGWATLGRNMLFAAGAGFLILQGRDTDGANVSRLVTNLTSQPLALPVGAIFPFLVAGWLFFHLLRQHGRLLLRIDNLELRLNASGTAPDLAAIGLPIGSIAPAFALPLLSGETLSLNDLLKDGKPVLVIFSDSNCSPCKALLPDLAHWEHELANVLTFALISRGSVKANLAMTQQYGIRNTLIQHDREVAEKYVAHATPSAVVVRADGSIGSSLAVGSLAINGLVAHTTGTGVSVLLPVVTGNGHHRGLQIPHSIQSGLRIGELAPSFRLPDLNGRLVELTHFEGRDTLVLFWNPNCRFCNEMLPQLKSWEKNRGEKGAELLLISTGTVETNRAMELQSTVVLDQSFSAGLAFGIAGTPSAVLVNAKGRIVSSGAAVGAPAILALAGSGSTTKDT
jgi:peroxiredoxin